MRNLDGLNRRELLGAGVAALAGARGLSAGPANTGKSCILLFLVGGPSQLDTWDPKPEAPSGIRGPFAAIETNVAGIRISENFPRMARLADRYALIRSCYHTGAAVHDTGHRIMQTGRACEDGVEDPHAGALAAQALGAKNGMPAHVLLPGPIGSTGGDRRHGQGGGTLGSAFDPVVMSTNAADLRGEPESVRAAYGMNEFGQSCLRARRLVEAGTRFVTVNMFDTVFDRMTWDIHGSRPFSPISCYRDSVGPMFDRAYSALLQDLSGRGLLADTLVVSMGEFGRTPHINLAGGRDHWQHCFTIAMAGGGVRGGQVIGSSDAIGAEPKDRPVAPGEVLATIRKVLGVPLGDARPIGELFV